MSSPQQEPTIHAASRGDSGSVVYEDILSLEQAQQRRKNGDNVVVRGNDPKANRRLAKEIEAAVGPPTAHPAHRKHPGDCKLPHYQQAAGDHPGHTFFEEPGFLSRRKK